MSITDHAKIIEKYREDLEKLERERHHIESLKAAEFVKMTLDSAQLEIRTGERAKMHTKFAVRHAMRYLGFPDGPIDCEE